MAALRALRSRPSNEAQPLILWARIVSVVLLLHEMRAIRAILPLRSAQLSASSALELGMELGAEVRGGGDYVLPCWVRFEGSRRRASPDSARSPTLCMPAR